MAPPHPRGPCAPSVAGVQVRPLVCGTRQRPAEQTRGTGSWWGDRPNPRASSPPAPGLRALPPGTPPPVSPPQVTRISLPIRPWDPGVLPPSYWPLVTGLVLLALRVCQGGLGYRGTPGGSRGQGRAPMQVLLIEPIRDWMRGKTALGVGRPRPGAGGAAVLSACERACVGQGQPTRGWGQCSWWAGPRGPGWHPVASGDAV